MDRLNENASQIDKEFRRACHQLQLKERELIQKYGNDSLNGTQSLLQSSLNFQKEKDEERLKLKLKEIEDNIKATLAVKEEAYLKLQSFNSMLQEAEDSMNHAQQSKNFTSHTYSNDLHSENHREHFSCTQWQTVPSDKHPPERHQKNA